MKNPLERRRRVLPRWRDPSTTTRIGELAEPNTDRTELSAHAKQSLQEAEQGWELAKSADQPLIPVELAAAEFIGEAVVSGVAQRASEAAKFLLEAETLPALIPLLNKVYRSGPRGGQGALPVASDISHVAIARDVREVRRRLRLNPRDPLGWSELARLHTTLGLSDKAEREMKTALSLAKDHRYVVRSGARFYVHQGDLERAHELVRAASGVASDPWLMASEIALASAAHKRSLLMRHARRLLADRGAHSSFATSELASAVATEELEAGGDRRTRRLFRSALIDPHENALAQVEWARQRGLALDHGDLLNSVEHSYEARARDAYAAHDWQLTVNEAFHWQTDQPFSSQPAVLGSFLCITVFDRHQVALDLCQRALIANPGDATLLNNLAVAQMELGDLDGAVTSLKELNAQPGTAESVAATASRGMLAYRLGQPELGEKLYATAIETAEHLRDARLAATATAFAAREELRSGREGARAMMSAAEVQARRVADPAVSALVKRVLATDERMGITTA